MLVKQEIETTKRDAPSLPGDPSGEWPSKCRVDIKPLNFVWIIPASSERHVQGTLLSSADVAVLISEGDWGPPGGITRLQRYRLYDPSYRVEGYTRLGYLVTSYASSHGGPLVEMLFRP